MSDRDLYQPGLERRGLLTGFGLAAAALPLALATQAAAQGSLSSMSAPVTNPEFDPLDFPVVTPKRFADLRIGDIFRMPPRTLTIGSIGAADGSPGFLRTRRIFVRTVLATC